MAEKKVAFKLEVKTGKAEKGVEGLTNDVKGLKKETKEFGDIAKKSTKGMEGGFQGVSDKAQMLGGHLGGAASSAVGFAAGLRSMTKAAISFIMTPIGAIIAAIALALAALSKWFTATEKGAQVLRVAMAAAGAVMAEVMDFVFGLAEGFGKLMTMDIKGAVNTWSGAFSGLADGMANGVSAAIELEKALNNLKVANRELSVETAEARSEIKKLNKDAEDVTLSFEERAEAAGRASEIEKRLLAERLKLAEENVRIIKEQNALSTSSEEDLQRLADAEIKLANIRTESLELQTTIQNKFNAIRQAQEAARLAAEQKRQAALKAQALAEEKLEAERQQRHADEIKRIQDEADLRFELAERAANKEVETYEALRDTRVLLEQDEEAREIAAAQLKLTRRLETIMGANELERQLRNELEEISAIEIQAIRDKHALAREQKQQAHNDKVLAEEQRIADAKISLASTVGGILGQIGQMINQESEAGVVAAKTLAVAQIAIDTAMSITSAIAGATSAAAATGPGAVIATPIFIATQIATVLAGIGQATAILNSAKGGGPSARTPSFSASSIPTSAPSGTQVSTNTTLFNQDQVNQANLGPVQAFVVETEMTSTQYNIEQIQGQATIGG